MENDVSSSSRVIAPPAPTQTAAASPQSQSTSVPPNAEGFKVGSPDVAAVTTVDKSASVDTVEISSQALQAASDVKKGELQKAEVKKDAVVVANKDLQLKAATAGVQFIYNENGDLITKYLDVSGNLVYQVPSKLMLLLRDLNESSLNTTV